MTKYNMNNKITLSLIAFAAITYTSCTGSKNENSTTDNSNPQDIAACADIKGQWTIETIALSDSDYIRPAEQVPGVRQYITFEDSTYFIKTNCNSFSGTYTIKGDSITLGDGAMTEMACYNMVTEDAIRQILPNIAAVNFENDSTARLYSHNTSEYIVLRKASNEKTEN